MALFQGWKTTHSSYSYCSWEVWSGHWYAQVLVLSTWQVVLHMPRATTQEVCWSFGIKFQ